MGDTIRGNDNLPVSYSYSEDGEHIFWSSNSNHDTRRIGSAMIKTETGKKAFEKMQSVAHDVVLKLSNEYNENYPEFGNTVNFGTWDKDNVNFVVRKSVVTIFPKAFVKYKEAWDALVELRK